MGEAKNGPDRRLGKDLLSPFNREFKCTGLWNRRYHDSCYCNLALPVGDTRE